MKVDRVKYTEESRNILTEQVDCIWFQLEKQEKGLPLTSKTLQWLDWKMRGQLLRFLESQLENPSTTFFPSMKKLSAPYLVLQTAKSDWETFFKNCKGLQLRKVLFFCKDEATAKENSRYLSKHSDCEFPETIFCTFEGAGENA